MAFLFYLLGVWYFLEALGLIENPFVWAGIFVYLFIKSVVIFYQLITKTSKFNSASLDKKAKDIDDIKKLVEAQNLHRASRLGQDGNK